VDKRSLVLYLSGLAAAGAVVGLAASCSDQPRIKCTAGHGPFAAVYTPVGGAENCGLAGGQIGVEAYNYPLPSMANLDPNRGSLGMQPLAIDEEIANHRAPDMNPAHKPYALGDWGSSGPGADNFCAVPNISVIEQDLGPIEAVPPSDAGPGTPYSPPISLKYEWTNVRFYATAASPGTQLIADLAYTKTTHGVDGGAPSTCTAQFRVVGLWPAVHCESDDDPTKPDETKCSPDPDPSKNRPVGSGISPDLATRCDPTLLLCVLAKDPPSFK
jgi:hypothetical protein